MIQIYPWLKFYLPLFLGMVMYDNEFETMENKISIKDKIEHIIRFVPKDGSSANILSMWHYTSFKSLDEISIGAYV